MHILRGCAALSDFRLEKLKTRILEENIKLDTLSAHFVHFIHSQKEEFTERQLRVLESLLAYGFRAGASHVMPVGEELVVIPRFGTISPWSSKATDIANNVGLVDILRIERGVAYNFRGCSDLSAVKACLYDRMTETVIDDVEDAADLFVSDEPRSMTEIPLCRVGRAALIEANTTLGLALADDEIEYLESSFSELDRDPTDVELMMFAQANSEHCRHKIFNASWSVDGKEMPRSLFSMIKHTNECGGDNVLSAYADNAAVIAGSLAGRFYPNPTTRSYEYSEESIHLLMKVETHNHPTAIAPYAGAGTGAGGEIRDEGAVGRGSKPKVGLTGFSVSNLHIPGYGLPWEKAYGKPDRIVSSLDVMLEGPIGGAAYNNEFGRPNLCGYFRTFEEDFDNERRGYHKPIMLAGGYGNIKQEHVDQHEFSAGHQLIVLGGPAMLIGLGGGAASSMNSGSSSEQLDYASVQRQNPEMERRCQEVVDQCWQLGEDNPIAFIHDVGAGGLSNAFPELAKDGGCGALFDLRKVPSDEPGMSPLELWCNESQERYVLAVAPQDLERFEYICRRERCPYSVVGTALDEQKLVLNDRVLDVNPIDLPMSVLFGKAPKMHREAMSRNYQTRFFDHKKLDLSDAVERVIQHPSVASKLFLITIGDRSVTGMVARDQLVGPWQIPVADNAVTTTSYQSYVGEAMSLGERTPLALLDGPASGRMAIGEALTNIASAPTGNIENIKLSANWMCAAGHPGEDEKLYRTVEAVGMELCPKLGITIPVGKDSMSMRTAWREGEQEKAVTSPLSLIITAFAPLTDVRLTITPQLRSEHVNSALLLIDLAEGKTRLGASILAQVFNQIGHESPDFGDIDGFKCFFKAFQQCLRDETVIAYHDRSDGGLLSTVAEMCFAGHCGVELDLTPLGDDLMASLFNEELGAVIQVDLSSVSKVRHVFAEHGVEHCLIPIGKVSQSEAIQIKHQQTVVYQHTRAELQELWSKTSFAIQGLRDNPICAQQEFDRIRHTDPGLSVHLTYDLNKDITAPFVGRGLKPRVAILREQGVNGQVEMAAAFTRAGFDAVDVHMSDIVSAVVSLDDFIGLAACGGFSYGDVLGAGEGWAKTILFNQRARDQFENFFHRGDTFSLGVCNGCQMMSNVKQLIPGAEHWPHFVRNISEQFEARFSLVKIEKTSSVLFAGMEGSHLPVAIAHGEGRAEFTGSEHQKIAEQSGTVALRLLDTDLSIANSYPANPNGSPSGMTGFTSLDGRSTIMMPHPERVFRAVTNSWHPDGWKEDGAWLRLFRNARVFVG